MSYKNFLNNSFKNSVITKINNVILNNFGYLFKEVRENNELVESFLKNNLLDKIINLKSDGFTLKNSHEKLFNEKMTLLIEKNPLDIFESAFINNLNIEDKYLVKLFFSSSGQNFLINKELTVNENLEVVNNKNTKYFYTANILTQKLNNKKFKRKLFLEWKYILTNCKDESFNNIKHIIMIKKDFYKNTVGQKSYNMLITNKDNLILNKLFMSEAKIHEYLDSMNFLEQIIKNIESLKLKKMFILNISKSYKKEISSPLINLINYMKSELDSFFNKDLVNINKNLMQFNEVLPLNVNMLIDNIQDNYKIIQNNKNIIHQHQIDDIDSLIKRVPEILKKYLSLEKNYRKNLKNIQGKTAETLIVESLTNINIMLENTINDINQQKLTSLSITQRYIKEIKNNYK